ncbi:MAG: NTP transferase domain-containing protein [Promethearchaeota archaeon]|jgi:NDP-sugar pyrophosphorylase family protein
MEIQLLPQEKNKEKNVIPIILCAGKGTRYGKITRKIPKPLIKINALNNITILHHLIRDLSILRVSKIAVVTGYLSEQIEAFLDNLIKKHWNLKDKLVLVHSGEDYKKGPLFSLLSIIKNKNIYKKDKIFIVFPGDTIFTTELLKEIFSFIYENFDLVLTSPYIFYQEIQAKNLYKSYKGGINFISILESEETKPKIKIKEIKKIDINSVPDERYLKKIIPILVLNCSFLEILNKLSKSNPVEEIREILNVYLKQCQNLVPFKIDSKKKFYDIDTIDDLNYFNRLKREKKGGQ